jgi:hypothetical protein
MIGKPQPLKIPQVEKPSLEQSTTKATRIQIEQLLFCMQQFIKEPPVSLLRNLCKYRLVFSPFALWQSPQLCLSNIVYSRFRTLCDKKQAEILEKLNFFKAFLL